jgi:hypothetical protein
VKEPIYPFRWDVTKRSQLGTLLDIPEEERAEWFEREMYRAMSGPDWSSADHSVPPAQWFERELSLCCAKVLAFCDDSDLYFVGRSPGSIFDFLSGLLFETSWSERLMLVHFSTGFYDNRSWWGRHTERLGAFLEYLEHIGLSPRAIAGKSRPTAFVDVVAYGRTFERLFKLLHMWSGRTYSDWPAVRRKLRIVGLTARTKTSPKTWRWQQHTDWVDLLDRGSIRNISIPSALFSYLAGTQSKTTRSYPPPSWGDPKVLEPPHDDPDARLALAQAVSLFDNGRDKATRRVFVTQMAEQPAMRYRWYRALAQEIVGQ